MRATLPTLFAPHDFERRIGEVLTAIAPLPIEPPRHPGGALYGPSTLRVLGPGGAIDLHCENETLGFPAMTGLREQLDPTSQLSFYVLLQAPEAGGALRISSMRHDEAAGQKLGQMPRAETDTLDFVDGAPFVTPDLAVGDMVIFDAGRHYHRVTEVERGERWTLGGFVAQSRDHARMYYWA